MSIAVPSPRAWKKPPLIKRAWLRWTLGLGAALYLALALGSTEVNWHRVWEGLPRGAQFIKAFFPPDFTSRWDEIVEGINESLWMTVVSTVVGIALSIPVGIGAARNIAPVPVYYFCRAVLAVSRSFQEIILAIFFVKLFGFGPFAGVVTLSLPPSASTASCSPKTSRTWMSARRKPSGDRRRLAAMDQLRRTAAG